MGHLLVPQHEPHFQRMFHLGPVELPIIIKFEDDKRQGGFNVLVVMPPLSSTSHAMCLTTIRDAELLLGECKENLNKIDTAAQVNTDILAAIGHTICANLVLLCRLFLEIQAENNANHLVPYLYKVTTQLCDVVTTLTLLDMAHGEQADLVSFAVIACLDTIFVNIAKETTDPKSVSCACSNGWTSSPSKQFWAVQTALSLASINSA